jgi:hypothetical protein
LAASVGASRICRQFLLCAFESDATPQLANNMTSARQWLNITPHKISLAILTNTYVNDPELDNQTKSEVGWLLIDEITVRHDSSNISINI